MKGIVIDIVITTTQIESPNNESLDLIVSNDVAEIEGDNMLVHLKKKEESSKGTSPKNFFGS